MVHQNEEYKDLVLMEKTRKKPKAGDIFLIQPQRGLYYYGKVIKANIINPFLLSKWNLIFIYHVTCEEPRMPSLLDPAKLLIPPQIVNNQGWLQGYFLTIGSMEVTEDELSLNYGFYSPVHKCFLTEEHQRLLEEPKIWTTYGIGSYGTVGRYVQQYLNDPTQNMMKLP